MASPLVTVPTGNEPEGVAFDGANILRPRCLRPFRRKIQSQADAIQNGRTDVEE